jgi:hypothetical protein
MVARQTHMLHDQRLDIDREVHELGGSHARRDVGGRLWRWERE